MDALASRQEQTQELTSTDMVSKLQQRFTYLSKINAVVQEAIDSGAIEPWEYPQVEQALGIFAATVHGVPVPHTGTIRT